MLVIAATLNSSARALQWGERGLDFEVWDGFPGNGAMAVGTVPHRGSGDGLCWNKPHITRFQGLQLLLKAAQLGGFRAACRISQGKAAECQALTKPGPKELI